MSHNPIIYVVDDNVASLESIRALMTTYGFNVETYTSAEEFLAAYDENCEGCLILDVRLEGMSGLELQQTLLSRGASLPIIMISGHADETIHGKAISNGALAVLEKPFAGSELLEWVRAALPNSSG